MPRQSKKVREKLGNRIQKLRKSYDYSQEEFAEMVGLSRTHVGHIEQGRKAPSLKVLEKIAKALKVTISDLFS